MGISGGCSRSRFDEGAEEIFDIACFHLALAGVGLGKCGRGGHR